MMRSVAWIVGAIAATFLIAAPLVAQEPSAAPDEAKPQAPQAQVRVSTRVHVDNHNGQQIIEVKEGEPTIRIHSRPNGPYTVTVTEKVNGTETTAMYQAQDDREFNRKFPEIAQITRGYVGFVAIASRGPIDGKDQAKQPAPPYRVTKVSRHAVHQLQEANHRVEAALEQAQKLAQENEALKPLVDELQKAQQALEAARRQIRP